MSELLRVLGIVAWIVSGWLVYSALNIEVAIPVSADAALAIGADTVANTHLMHIQLIGFLAGALLSVSGSILFVGGLLLGRTSASSP